MLSFSTPSQRRMFKAGAVAVAALGVGLTAACASMTSPGMMGPGMMGPENAQATMASWPESSRMAAMDMMKKYGPPQEITPTSMLWRNNGPWKWTRVRNVEIQHNFPMPHPDVMEQAINYRVPSDMFDELAMYDGSVIAERTRGELSARCDKEGANFLAVNLANDVATRRRTVEQARQYYAAAIKTFMSTGSMDPYMQRLQFQPPAGDAGDPDVAAMAG